MTAPAGAVAHRSAAIDGLRGLAALAVLVYHGWLYTLDEVASTNRDSLLDDVVHELRLGLVLFFVLSGFLLSAPWVRSALEGRPRPRTRPYLLRRVARIVPAYWLAIAGSIVLLYPLEGEAGVRVPPEGDLWRFPLFLQNISSSTLLKLDPPMWTLAVEWAFYLLLPVLGWIVLRRRGTPLVRALAVPFAFGLVGVLYNLRLAYGDAADAFVLSKQLPAMAPYFAVGMIAAVLVHGRRPSPRVVRALAAAGVVTVLVGSVLVAWAASTPEPERWPRIWRDLMPAIGFALVLASVALAPRRVPVLASRPAELLGRVSFGVYLWHVPLLLVLRHNGLLPSGWLAASAVVLVPTLLVSAASWRWIEAPAQAWARRRTARAPAVTSAAAAPG